MIAPPRRRAEITEEAGALKISMPARRHWLLLAVLVGWGLISAAWAIAVEPGRPFWIASAAICVGLIVWLVRAREVVVIDRETLTLSCAMLVYSPRRTFDLREVCNLRAIRTPWRPSSWTCLLRRPGLGRIGFDCGAETIRFAHALDEAEASQIVSRITLRFPSLVRADT